MRWVRYSLWILAGIFVFLVVGIGGSILWIDSRAGKAWLEAKINTAAGDIAQVTTIGGSLPFHPTAELVELIDAGGRWASLREIQLDITPLDLLRRRVTVQRLTAASIEIDRLPQPRETAPNEPQQPAAQRQLPQLPVAIDVQQLGSASLSLPPDLLGEPTQWTVNAAAHLIGRDLGLNLQAAEIGASPLRLNFQFDLSESRVGAQANLDDPRGLLLKQAMGEARPIQVRLTDDPSAPQNPGDWRGRLTAAIGDNSQLDAALRLSATAESIHFETRGMFDGADLLPPAIAPLLGNAVGFNIVVRELAGERITLETMDLQAATFEAMGAGTYLMNENHVETSLRLAVPELARFSNLAGQSLAGAAVLDIVGHGPLDKLRVKADLNASRLGAGPVIMEHTHARLEAEIASGQGYNVQGWGRLADVRTGDAALPARLGELIEWQLRGYSDATGQRAGLTQFEVSTAGLNLSAKGALDRITQDVNGALHLRLDELRRYAELAIPGLTGRGEITADLTGKLSGPLVVKVDGGFDDLATGIPAADAMIGGRLRLDAAAQRSDGGRIEIDSASLATASARLTARGIVDPTANQVNGELAALIDDLSVLRRAGLQTKGRLRLDAQVNGSPSAPAVDARLAGSGLAWQTAQIDRLTARLQAKMEGSPSGNLTADLQSRDLAVRLEGQAALSPDRKILNVPRLRLRSGASIVEARLRTALDTLLTSGQITANVPDLARWSSLAGMDLGGRFDLNLGLSTPRGGQAAELTFAANDLRAAAMDAEPITVRRLSANGQLSDLLRRPTGRIEMNGGRITAAGVSLDELRVNARSTEPNRFAFDGSTTGEFKGQLDLSTAGNVALDRGTTRVTLTRLAGRLADTALALQRSLLVTMAGPSLALSNLALAVGDGTIEGMAKRDASRLDVDITARRLPIGLGAALAGRPGISGALDLQIAVAGPAAQPRGRLALDARDLRAGPTRRDQPVIGVSATADIAPSEVNVEAAATAGGNRLLSASGAVPVVFGPAPGAVALAEQRPLRLRARGEGELTQFSDLLPLAGDRLAGAFRLALDAEGPATRPQVLGELSLDRGRYENRASGLVVDALALQIVADRDRVTLRRLEATDGEKGQLKGSGSILLNGGQTPAADATVTIADFRALRRSDATLIASGSTSLKGPMDALMVVSRITVDEAEFFIPDPPPASAKKIPVTVIDSTTGRVLEQPTPPAAASKSAVGLDIAVHVPGRTFIRGRGLDSEWEGDIHVRGTSAVPELTGALKVAKGKFAFFGKDLALTRGTVTFTGSTKIEPDLDVLAETANAGTTFQVGAAGTPEDLKIKLSSIPPLPEDEILSRLIFGREMTRLTPAQGLQLAQAAATLSSGGPGMFDKMRQKLGLDTLNVGSGSGNGTADGSRGAEDTGVSAGKYVADGVYVGAEQRLSGETRSKVEIEIMPNVSVETTAGNRGESVGVIWKWDY